MVEWGFAMDDWGEKIATQDEAATCRNRVAGWHEYVTHKHFDNAPVAVLIFLKRPSGGSKNGVELNMKQWNIIKFMPCPYVIDVISVV